MLYSYYIFLQKLTGFDLVWQWEVCLIGWLSGVLKLWHHYSFALLHSVCLHSLVSLCLCWFQSGFKNSKMLYFDWPDNLTVMYSLCRFLVAVEILDIVSGSCVSYTIKRTGSNFTYCACIRKLQKPSSMLLTPSKNASPSVISKNKTKRLEGLWMII